MASLRISSIFMVGVVVILLFCSNSVVPLECFSCLSYYSWEDCDKYRSRALCDSYFNTCLTLHTIRYFDTGQQSHRFIRSCFHSDSCTQEQCSKTALKDARDSCELYCCDTKLCNSCVTPWASDKGYVLQYLPKKGIGDVIRIRFQLVVMAMLVAISANR